MYIRYENRQVRRVTLRDEEGAVICDVRFDSEGRARCRKEEAELLAERGFEFAEEGAEEGG